jgi:hypothetical protein
MTTPIKIQVGNFWLTLTLDADGSRILVDLSTVEGSLDAVRAIYFDWTSLPSLNIDATRSSSTSIDAVSALDDNNIDRVENKDNIVSDGLILPLDFGISFISGTNQVSFALVFDNPANAEAALESLVRIATRGSIGDPKAEALVAPITDIFIESNSWLKGFETLLGSRSGRPDMFVVGEKHVLELKATNTGNVTLTNVEILFKDPSRRLDLVSILGSVTGSAHLDPDADTVKWEIASLAPGASLNLQFTGFLDQNYNFLQGFSYEGKFGSQATNEGDSDTNFERFANRPFSGFSNYEKITVLTPGDTPNDPPKKIEYSGAASRVTGKSSISGYESFGSLPFKVNVNADSDFTRSFIDKNVVAAGALKIDKEGGGIFFFDDSQIVEEGSRISRSTGEVVGSPPTPAKFETRGLGKNVFDTSGAVEVFFRSTVEGDGDSVSGGLAEVSSETTLFYQAGLWESPTSGVKDLTLNGALGKLAELSTDAITLDIKNAPATIGAVPTSFGTENNINTILLNGSRTFDLGSQSTSNQIQEVDFSTVNFKIDPTGGVANLTFNFGNGSDETFIAPNQTDATRTGVGFAINMGNGSNETVVFYAGDRMNDIVDFGLGGDHVVKYKGLDYSQGMISGTRSGLTVKADSTIGQDTFINADRIIFENGIFNVTRNGGSFEQFL